MGVRDVRRLDELRAAQRGGITNREGAERLGVSLRHFKRLRRRLKELGVQGLVHGNRGKLSARRLSEAVRERTIALLTEVTVRVNDHHISDLLEEEGHTISPDSVRRLRRELRLPPKQRRRPPRHHRRRTREEREGSMVLIDGSPHQWLGAEQGVRTLVGTIDDATGKILALTFREQEDLHGYVAVLDRTLRDYGVPDTLYGDHTGIAVRNDKHWTLEEELLGRQDPTQFGQMLEELGIRYIAAHSPQAKGRIERLWRTVQDRLIAELALKKITTWPAAEAFVSTFIPRYNQLKAQPPAAAASAWRTAPRQLELVMACRYRRTVGRDNVVSFFRVPIAIPPGPHRRSYHDRRVEVRELLSGRVLVLHQGRVLVEHPCPQPDFHLQPREERGRTRSPRNKAALGSPRIDDRPRQRLKARASRTITRPTKSDPRLKPGQAWRGFTFGRPHQPTTSGG